MIVLTLEESAEEYIAGIPGYIEFSTSKPATVFYTLDGTIPDSNSLIAVGKVYMPTDGGAVTLRAIAISSEDSSAILEEEYSTDSTDLSGPRHVGGEGIIVMPYGEDAVEALSVNSDGEQTQASSILFEDLDIKASSVDSDGTQIEDGKTSVSFVNFPSTISPNDTISVSYVNNNAEFDPSAKFIIIDGSTDELTENQVVKIVNRTYSTFGPTSKFYDERLGEKEPIVTGNYVKSFYNEKTGIYVSYYWESLESRWMKSIQRVERVKVKGSNKASNSFVYRWIQDRSLSQIF